jgi:hypothetical protein
MFVVNASVGSPAPNACFSEAWKFGRAGPAFFRFNASVLDRVILVHLDGILLADNYGPLSIPGGKGSCAKELVAVTE